MRTINFMVSYSMKLALLFVALTSICIDTVAQSKNLEVPMIIRSGNEPFENGNVSSFRIYPHWQAEGNAPLSRALPKLKGIPKAWTGVTIRFVWFDIQQFVYQRYKEGKVSRTDYDSLVKSLHVDLKKRLLSARPINCFAPYVSGKDASGKLLYKIDLNHNLNFSDDPIQLPKANTAHLKKLHPNDGMDTVEYQTIRNGKIVKREAFLEVFPFDSVVHVNIKQFGVANVQGKNLYFTSHGLASADYEYAEMYLLKEFSGKTFVDEIYEDDFFTIRDSLYQYLRVDLNKEVVQFKKIEKDTMVFGVHEGLYAPHFKAADVEGNVVDLGDYKGKFLYVDFWPGDDVWATRRSMQMQNVYARTSRSKIDFVQFVELNEDRTVRYFRDHPGAWKKLLLNDRQDILKNYMDVRNVLIDPSGKVVLKNIDGDDLLEVIFGL